MDGYFITFIVIIIYFSNFSTTYKISVHISAQNVENEVKTIFIAVLLS